ncbi:hypothetical protein CCP4SC76_6900018 [Gammaproteobacteria bacterium]
MSENKTTQDIEKLENALEEGTRELPNEELDKVSGGKMKSNPKETDNKTNGGTNICCW